MAPGGWKLWGVLFLVVASGGVMGQEQGEVEGDDFGEESQEVPKEPENDTARFRVSSGVAFALAGRGAAPQEGMQRVRGKGYYRYRRSLCYVFVYLCECTRRSLWRR